MRASPESAHVELSYSSRSDPIGVLELCLIRIAGGNEKGRRSARIDSITDVIPTNQEPKYRALTSLSIRYTAGIRFLDQLNQNE